MSSERRRRSRRPGAAPQPGQRESEHRSLARAATDRVDPLRVLAGGGEMGELARSIDWAQTPIGPVETWSQALRSTVALLLHNQSDILLWWGPEFVQIYNDAYRPVLGDKHPRAMGQTGRECWAEIWHIIGPMVERPYRGGPASTSDDLMLPLRRKNFLEEAHFRIAYSPVPDDTVEPSGIGGVLATITETTQQVYGERQLRTLRELGERSAAQVNTVEEACAAAADTLAGNPWDVPFALFYLFDADGKRARLVATTGFAAGAPAAVAPPAIDLRADSEATRWSLRQIATKRDVLIVDDLARFASALPPSPWSERPNTAVVLPLASPDQPIPYGALICGVSPHRALDAGYRGFFEIAAAQIVSALRTARAFEEERKRAEALAELDRAKTVFFSNVSHEFRTPLTLMLGPTEDLLSGAHGPLGDEQRRQLELIQRNELRLHKLVNSLLDFARIESGRIQASYEPTDLAALTRDIASAFRSAIERAGLAFEVDCAALDEPIYVDRDMWEKVVMNLLSNAFKFTFEGAITVSLRSEGEHAVLCVADTGVGVPAEELPHLFERFRRVQGTRARTHEGSGIGLALVQELAKLHGGTVHAESRSGAGTAFRVVIPKGASHLPRERIGAARSIASTSLGHDAFVQEMLRWLPDAPARSTAGSDGVPAAAPVSANSPRARVLLADDNADMRDYVRRVLEPRWIVEAVEDGASALASACERVPDLVLTDVMMPRLDGFGLLRELRAREATRAVPVIMLSARAGEESRVEGLAAGADDYLVKPFSARELIARVHVHLENVRLRHAAEAERDRLRGLLSRVPAIVNFLRGPELIVEFAHPLAIETLGGRDIAGKPLLEAIPEFRDQEYPALLRKVLETGEPIEGREKLVRYNDGDGRSRESYWNFVYLPVRDGAGHVEGVMTFDIDVSEQVRARRERERQLAEAERAVRFSEIFVGILGHDLRNPLSAIGVAAQLLQSRAESERSAAPVRRIVSNVQRMERMISQLLDFTMIRLGRGLPLERTRFDLAEECRATVEELRRLDQPAIDIEVLGDAGGAWDRDRILQLLSNLAANARQHGTPDMPVRIRVDGTSADAVRLEFHNHGVIAPELLPFVFEPLRRGLARPERRDGSSGLGLGLYISQQIVAAHGGSIRAESSAAGGTRFIVELPRTPGVAPEGVFSAETSAGARAAASSRSS